MQTTKICQQCGRIIEPRKKWKNNWDEIKFCSDKCRKNKSTFNYENQIMDLLKLRGFDKTICPSEVLPNDLKKNKEAMEHVRQSARKLVAKGDILITQGGHAVDPSTAKGAIRLKLIKKGS